MVLEQLMIGRSFVTKRCVLSSMSWLLGPLTQSSIRTFGSSKSVGKRPHPVDTALPWPRRIRIYAYASPARSHGPYCIHDLGTLTLQGLGVRTRSL